MVENQRLLNRKRVFKDAKYIIVIEEETSSEDYEWQGVVKELLKYNDVKRKEQRAILKDFSKNIVESVSDNLDDLMKEVSQAFMNKTKICMDSLQKMDDVLA